MGLGLGLGLGSGSGGGRRVCRDGDRAGLEAGRRHRRARELRATRERHRRHPLIACGANTGGTCGRRGPRWAGCSPCQPPCASGALGAQAAVRLRYAGKPAALCAVNAAAAASFRLTFESWWSSPSSLSSTWRPRPTTAPIRPASRAARQFGVTRTRQPTWSVAIPCKAATPAR